MPKLTTGDARRQAADDLYAKLEGVVDFYKDIERTYWIVVIVKNHYQGPMEVQPGKSEPIETTEMTLPDKMIHNRIVAPLFYPPVVRQLGTMLWRVENRKGRMTLEYALPQDVPSFLEDSDNDGQVVGQVAQAAQGIPLIYS